MDKMPIIFEYLDYRQFLNDCYEGKQENNAQLSLRYFAHAAEVSAGTLVRVLKGQRDISLELGLKLAKSLKLTKKETEYFQQMILYEQAGSSEKTVYLNKLIDLRGTKLDRIDTDKFSFFAHWYNVVIKELVNIIPSGNCDEISRMLMPSVSVEEVHESIKLLLRLGLIEQTANGSFKLAAKRIATPEKWHSAIINCFQYAMVQLACEAIQRFEKDARDISTMTMSISQDGLARIKDRIRQFHSDIADIVRTDTDVDQVFQVNVQVFPVSKRRKRKLS